MIVGAFASGDRKTLKFDAYIPATMAAIYLLLLLYALTFFSQFTTAFA